MELSRYDSFSVPKKSCDILSWWKRHATVLPMSSKLARFVLSIPASISKSERVFSSGSNISTPKRSSLAAGKLEKMLIIREK